MKSTQLRRRNEQWQHKQFCTLFSHFTSFNPRNNVGFLAHSIHHYHIIDVYRHSSLMPLWRPLAITVRSMMWTGKSHWTVQRLLIMVKWTSRRYTANATCAPVYISACLCGLITDWQHDSTSAACFDLSAAEARCMASGAWWAVGRLCIARISCNAALAHPVLDTFIHPSIQVYYDPTVGKGAISVAFVRPSVCLSVRLTYIANNPRTQRPSVPKVGRKVPHLRCDSHTSFKVKRSKVKVGGGRGHTVSAELGGHTACFRQKSTENKIR